MKLKQLPGLCLLALFALASCKKGSSPKPAAKLDAGVYAVGYQEGVTGAILWKNGVATQPAGFSTFFASAIAINGNDMYVAGSLLQYPISTAIYWKNGVITKLIDGSTDAQAYDINISGNNVYVAGYISSMANTNTAPDLAAYWKNGVLNKLTNTAPSSASKIVVSGTDVYVLGSIFINKMLPVYWKNGVINFIGDTSKIISVGGMAVQNNNVYIAYSESVPGVAANVSYLSQNGVATPLANTFPESSVTSMLVNGSDIYVTGEILSLQLNVLTVTASYWKNNSLNTLPQIPGTKTLSYNTTTAIVASGNDVYIAGQSEDLAVYWKNGIAVTLGTDSSDLAGIAIVP